MRAGEVHFFYGGKGKGGTGSESGSDAGSDAESDAESDGMTTKIEGKISSKVACLPQVVAMNIMPLFTEHNLHPNKMASILTLLVHRLLNVYNEHGKTLS